MNTPVVYIDFIQSETKKDGAIYKLMYPMAQEALSILNIITQSEKQENQSFDNISTADEILKFKQLLDAGIITEEEFNLKKETIIKQSTDIKNNKGVIK